MTTLSILFVGNHLNVSGARFAAQDLAERLRRRGHVVRCTASRHNRLLRLHDMLRTAWKHRREYQVAEVDVYSGHAFLWAEAVCFLLRRIGRPCVLILHGGALPEFAARFPGRVRRLLQAAAFVAAPSPYLASELSGFRNDIRVIPNALDVASYPYVPGRAVAPRLVWLRAFHRMYRPELAIQVVKLLSGGFPDVRLTMFGRDMGDGSFRRARRLADCLEVSHRVDFRGAIPRSEVPARLSEASILLNTTDVDNTPVSLLEAMACGLCVVTTDAGGVPYLVRDGVDALVVRRGDAQAMAMRAAALIEDPGLAQRLSSAARRRAECSDWSRTLPDWEDLFRSAARSATT